MKLPELPDPDQPKECSAPRDLAESLWFGSVTERWLHEDAGHLPVVSIYDGQYGREMPFYVDRDGPILHTRARRPYSFVDVDGEVFTISRTKVGSPPPDDQIDAFQGLLETHDYQRKYATRVKLSGYASYQEGAQLAETLATFLATYGGRYLFEDEGISVGALVVAASHARVIIEDRPYGEFATAVKYGWKSEAVFLLLQNSWLDLNLDHHSKMPARNPVSKEVLESYARPAG